MVNVSPGSGSAVMSAIIETESGQLMRLDVKRSKYAEDCSGYIEMVVPVHRGSDMQLDNPSAFGFGETNDA